MTKFEQLQKSGIRRAGTPARGLTYRNADNSKANAADRARIDELRIPPAWTDVCINAAAGGVVQAIGRDAAGRLQYIYHANHVKRREARKFRRIIKFAETLPKMRTAVAAHIRLPGLGREPVMAAMLRILSTCFLRPGSQVYASENGSFGLATLRPRHVKVRGDTVELDFTGKSGVHQQYELKDRHVARIVRNLLLQPSREVFKYRNGDNEFVNVTRHHINDYIREVMGARFSAKDFRTWAGTLVCASALARTGTEAREKKTARKRKVVSAIRETAGVLGNTPAVCRSAYICPEIIEGFEQGRIIDSYFASPGHLLAYRGQKLHAAEKSLLAFMKRGANGARA